MKDIKGYEGLYAITSCGRVWSYRTEKFMKSHVNKFGYERIQLTDSNGNRKKFYVHVLVAKTYIPNKNKLPQVNHKDEIKTHNYINNLEWCTNEYNQNYGTRLKRISEKNKKNFHIRCIENDKIYTSYDQISKDLSIKREYIMKHMSEYIDKGWAISGYHFEEVM